MSPLKGGRDFGFATGGGEQGERREAGERDPPADRQAMGSGKTDADAGEAARSAIDEDRGGTPAGDQVGDHWHQPLGMTAADQLVALADQRAVRADQRR